MANYESYLNYLKHVDDVSKETHRKDIKDAVRQKEHEMQLLSEDYEAKLTDKDVEISKILADAVKAKQELAESHQHIVGELKAGYEKKIEEINNKTTSEKKSLSIKIDKQNEEIAKLKVNFKKKEHSIKQTFQLDCERLVCKLKEEASVELKQLSTLLKEKEGEIVELKTGISELRADLNDPYQKASEDLKSKHKKDIAEKDREISNTKAECKRQIEEINAKTSSELAKKDWEISNTKAKCKKQIDEINAKTSSEIAEKDREISNTKAECKRQIDEINAKTSSDLAEKDKEISRIKTEYQKQLNEYMVYASIKLADKEKAHVDEIEEMRREFQLFKERIKKEIQNRDNEIIKLQSEKTENRNTVSGLFGKLFK